MESSRLGKHVQHLLNAEWLCQQEMRGSNQRLDYVGITWDPDDWHLGLIGALGDILGVSVEQVVVKQHHINALLAEHQ